MTSAGWLVITGGRRSALGVCLLVVYVLVAGCRPKAPDAPPPAAAAAPAVKSYEMTRASIVGRYALLHSFRAALDMYQAPQCDCERQTIYRADGTLELTKDATGTKYRFEGTHTESAYLKGTKPESPEEHNDYTEAQSALRVFDGTTLYHEIGSSRVVAGALQSSGAEERSNAVTVIKGDAVNPVGFPFPKGWVEHPLDQFEKQGWRFAVLPDSVYDGRPVYVLFGQTAGPVTPALASRMRLYFDKETGILLRLEQYTSDVQPPVGETNAPYLGYLTLSKVEVDPAIPAADFTYAIPAGAVVNDLMTGPSRGKPAAMPGSAPLAAPPASPAETTVAVSPVVSPPPHAESPARSALTPELDVLLKDIRARWEKIASLRAEIVVLDDPICTCKVKTVKQGTGVFLYGRRDGSPAYRMDVVLRNTGYPREPGSPDENPVFQTTPRDIYGTRMTYVFDGHDAYQQTGRIGETPAAPAATTGSPAPAASATTAAAFEEPRDVAVTKGTLKRVNWFNLPTFAEVPLLGEQATIGNLRRGDDGEVAGRPAYVVQTLPQGDAHARYQRYWFDKETGVPLKVAEYAQPETLVNSYELTRVEVNASVDATLLAYQAPQGVVVTEMTPTSAPPTSSSGPAPSQSTESSTPVAPPSARALVMPDDVTELLAATAPKWDAITSLACTVKTIPEGNGPYAKAFPEATGRFVYQRTPTGATYRLELSGIAIPTGSSAVLQESVEPRKMDLLAVVRDDIGYMQTTFVSPTGSEPAELTVRRITLGKLLGSLPVTGAALSKILGQQADMVMTVMVPPAAGATLPDGTPSLFVNVEPSKRNGTPVAFVQSWTIGIDPQTGWPAFATAKAEGGATVGHVLFSGYTMNGSINAADFEYTVPAGAKLTDETRGSLE